MLVANDMPMDRCSVRHTGIWLGAGYMLEFFDDFDPLMRA